MPENAYTLVILLTDGRSEPTRPDRRAAANAARRANRAARIPVFAVGIGLDADLDFLSEFCERAGGLGNAGGATVNVIEDLEAAPQLAPFRANLGRVVLKNLRLNYVGGAFDLPSLTPTRFLAFRAGSAVAVAGRINGPGMGSLCTYLNIIHIRYHRQSTSTDFNGGHFYRV